MFKRIRFTLGLAAVFALALVGSAFAASTPVTAPTDGGSMLGDVVSQVTTNGGLLAGAVVGVIGIVLLGRLAWAGIKVGKRAISSIG